jgi:hypothetical protein
MASMDLLSHLAYKARIHRIKMADPVANLLANLVANPMAKRAVNRRQNGHAYVDPPATSDSKIAL